MTVNRTTLLDLPLPVTGTESGTWGDTTNNGLTQYVDIAVAGMTSLTSANFTAGALTLANTTGDSSATNIAAGSAQYGAIKVSSLATNSTITAPSSNRRYTIINADATYSVTIKASGQTGVTIVAGEKALVAFNGTDYVKIATANGTGEFTTVDTTNLEVTNVKAKDGTAAATIADSTGVVTVTAAPVMTALTASQAVFTTAGKALTSNAITGTGNVVMSASPTLTGTISAAAATLSGNLTLSGGTANGVLYLNGSKVATSGSALTFDGTNLGVGATSPVAKLQIGWSSDQLKFTNPSAGFKQIGASYTGYVSGNDYAAIILGTDGSSGGKIQFSVTPSAGSLTTAATLDQYGNLGLGVTPSVQYSTIKALQVGALGATVIVGNDSAGGTSTFGQNFYSDPSTAVFKYAASAQPITLYSQYAGEHRWFYASGSGKVAGDTASPSQYMTLDASGQLGVGVTSMAVPSTSRRGLQVSNGTSGGMILLSNSTTESDNPRIFGSVTTQYDLGFAAGGSTGFINWYTNGTERARITSGGDLLVGTATAVAQITSVSSSASNAAGYFNVNAASSTAIPAIYGRKYDNDNTTSQIYMSFQYNQGSGGAGGIQGNGATGVQFYSSSDARLKENIVDLESQLQNIMSLKPSKFDYIDGPKNCTGFIAQQIEMVYPDVIGTTTDGYKTIGGISIMETRLIKAIQEQQALIESLTSRVAQLEGV